MSTIEEIKRSRLNEMMAQADGNNEDQNQQALQQIDILENMGRRYLTKKAFERYTNLKLSHTDKAIQLLSIIYQLVQAGQIKGQLDDIKLKELIIKLTPKKQNTQIKRI